MLHICRNPLKADQNGIPYLKLFLWNSICFVNMVLRNKLLQNYIFCQIDAQIHTESSLLMIRVLEIQSEQPGGGPFKYLVKKNKSWNSSPDFSPVP